MVVAVIGITGRIGKRAVPALVARGVKVYGGNRRIKRVPDGMKAMLARMAQVDTGDPVSLDALIAGADAVLLAAAPTREHPEEYPEHSRNVIEACRRMGVKRLVAMSNYKALLAPDGRPMMDAEPAHPVFHDIEASFDAEDAVFRAEKELDWVLIAGGADTKPYAPARGDYRIQEDVLLVSGELTSFKDSSTISLDDLTACAVNEIMEPKHSRALICAAY